jgi:hypothetical protein
MSIMVTITSINTFLCLISKICVFLKSNRYKLLIIFKIYGILSFDNSISRKPYMLNMLNMILNSISRLNVSEDL